jgi:MFS superfamily sulfate permease-like transporter
VLRPTAGDLSGAIADLGIFVPLGAALVLVNGLEVGSVLIAAGLLVLAAGALFRIPFPVQPLKALTALAVAQGLSPDEIHAAGLQIGVVLLVLTVTGLADRLSRVFTHAVIRSLQLGVGVLLVISAVKLVRQPPAVFEHTPSPGAGLALAALALVAVGVAAWRRWYGLTFGLLVLGTCASWLATRPPLGEVQVHLPDVGVPPLAVFGTALVTLVVPQLPLTYGNAVVGVSALAREHFGEEARRVTPGRVALSCGSGNVVSALLGGMPMCHGSSGLSAHIRLGARTAGMNVLLGGVFLVLGLVLSGQVVTLFGLLPVWVLAGFLAYAGIRHALLVLDLRGAPLVMAMGAALVGVVTGNLAYTTATALVAAHGPRLLDRRAGGRERSQRN